MNDIFGSVFGLLEGVYGVPLANFLYEDGRAYAQTGLAMLSAALLVALAYYYIVDHPRLCSWRGWGASAAVCAAVSFGLAYARVVALYDAGMMVETNITTGEPVPIDVSQLDLLSYALCVGFVSLPAYFLISLIIKWRSVNCSHYPHF